MANSYFDFKQFRIEQGGSAMKVTTDACVFGAWVAQHPLTGRMLDIGAGTGLLSLMIAQQRNVQIDAVEIEAGAAGDALKNISRPAFAKRITVHHMDIRQWRAQPYDVIVSNPPFYEREWSSADSRKNMAHHHEGLRLVELFEVVEKFTSSTTQLFLHLPLKREPEISRLLAQFQWHVREALHLMPVEGKPATRLSLLLTREKNKAEIQNLVVKDQDNRYTETTLALLKPFYLFL